MFTICLHTKLNSPSSSGPVVIAVKFEDKLKVLHGHHVVIYSTENFATKLHILLISCSTSGSYVECRCHLRSLCVLHGIRPNGFRNCKVWGVEGLMGNN
jgi:hypothetical protein